MADKNYAKNGFYSYIYASPRLQPPPTPATTILTFELKSNVNVFDTQSEEGVLWQEALRLIAEETEWRSTILGRRVETGIPFMLFITWKEIPSDSFLDSLNSNTYPPSLSRLLSLFESPPEFFNVHLNPAMPRSLGNESRYSYELLTLTFPPHLVPTEDDRIAQNLYRFESFLGLITTRLGCEPPGDLITYRSAWRSDQSTGSNKTHIILLGWKDTASELRFKDPAAESKYRLAPPGPNDNYQRSFLAPLQTMIDKGIQTTWIHLSLERTQPLWMPRLD